MNLIYLLLELGLLVPLDLSLFLVDLHLVLLNLLLLQEILLPLLLGLLFKFFADLLQVGHSL